MYPESHHQVDPFVYIPDSSAHVGCSLGLSARRCISLIGALSPERNKEEKGITILVGRLKGAAFTRVSETDESPKSASSGLL